MALLSPSHRTSFDHHSTGIKAKWLINPLIDHVIDMGGRGDKAMSGNCCQRCSTRGASKMRQRLWSVLGYLLLLTLVVGVTVPAHAGTILTLPFEELRMDNNAENLVGPLEFIPLSF